MENESNEKSNDLKSDEHRAINATEPFQIVHTQCSVCNSGKLKEIHAARAGRTLVELAEKINAEFGLELSKDALSRHFIHYAKKVETVATREMFVQFNEAVESVAQHQKKTLFLGKVAFDHIVERIENGTLILGVDDFEKLIKLYYGVLRDPDSAGDENILAVFQRASEKYGDSLSQGVLLKFPKKSV